MITIQLTRWICTISDVVIELIQTLYHYKEVISLAQFQSPIGRLYCYVLSSKLKQLGTLIERHRWRNESSIDNKIIHTCLGYRN